MKAFCVGGISNKNTLQNVPTEIIGEGLLTKDILNEIPLYLRWVQGKFSFDG